MNWPTFVRRLVELAPGRAPTDDEVREAMLLAADDEDEHELLADFVDPRDAVQEVADGAPSATLVSFRWEGAYSSAVWVGLIESDGRGLLIQRDDTIPEEDFVIVACFPTPRRPGALVPYLDDIARRLDCSGLPLEIKNYAPNLLPVEAVHDLYAGVGWHDGGTVSVSDLLDQLDGPAALARVRQSLPADRSLRKALARLEALHDQDAELTDEDPQLLRDLHFALVYREPR